MRQVKLHQGVQRTEEVLLDVAQSVVLQADVGEVGHLGEGASREARQLIAREICGRNECFLVSVYYQAV